MRVLRTDTTSELEFATEGDPMGDLLMNTGITYMEGILENALPSVGQVAGRIDSLLPAAEIVRRTVEEFGETLSALGERYLRSSEPVAPTS
jgi:enoyl-[acyl-carrier protein] reductase II